MATEKSFIPGKDAALEDSIMRMKQQLGALGFHIEEHSWLNPLPHVWSVHIRDRDCPMLFTNGKGASKKAALASALGEFFERLATNYFWADFYLGDHFAEHEFVHYADEKWFATDDQLTQLPQDLLSAELIDFYDPEKALSMSQLVDINSANSERGVCALPYVRQRDQQTFWFPVNVIGNLYVSNGMSAGNTVNEARVQALSEIFERFVKFKIIEEGICLPDVPQNVIDEYPGIKEGIAKLEQKGFGVLVKDASLGGQFPVMNVTLLNPENQGCFASFGAHPNFEVALERSLTELLQGRELDQLNEFPAPIHDQDEVASQENLETHFIDSSGLVSWEFLKNTPDYEYSPCDYTGSTDEEFQWLCELIHQTGRDIYIADYDHLGVYACRVLVPSMSEIYACEDLNWENNNQGIHLRKAILDIAELSAQQADDLIDALEEADLNNIQPVAALIGLPPQANSLWKDYRIAELKVLLSAIAGRREDIHEGCEWLLGFGQLESSREQLYRCVLTLLEWQNPDEYSAVVKKIFTPAIVLQAEQLLSGKLTGFNFENKAHQLLIEAYEKLHRVKSH